MLLLFFFEGGDGIAETLTYLSFLSLLSLIHDLYYPFCLKLKAVYVSDYRIFLAI